MTPSIVLVHGGFVDGSGWAGVYRILKQAGYPVGVVQNPTISLAGDVAAAKQVIYVSQPKVVADLIVTAAKEAKA